MSTQTCRTCKWIRPVVKGSESDHWDCGCPSVPKPYVDQMMLQFARNPHYKLLSVGAPDSDFGSNCPTHEAKP